MSKRTLFLDRDGVINRQIIGGYVTRKEEFEFLPGVLEALARMAPRFDYIFIVTNQQGIGKGVFSVETLNEIHSEMIKEITTLGGRIDKIYFCPDLEKENSPNRKPAPGMGLQAKADFPEVNFENAIMVGDSVGDMEFGRNLGAKTVYLSKGNELPKNIITLTDKIYTDLADFAKNEN